MQIKVNGEPRDIETESTVAKLLSALSIKDARVAVEVNLEVIRRDRRELYVLSEGDQVEIVSFVGGGV